MEFLGIGPLELLFILLIALILLGPKDMAKSGRTIGRTLRKIVMSPQWRTITQTSKEIRNIPTRLMREAGLEEMQQDLNNLKKTTSDIQNTLRDSTILPPGWLGTSAPSKTSVETDPTGSRRDPSSKPFTGGADSDSPVLPPTNNSDNNSDLSAWTTPPDVLPSPPPPSLADPSHKK